MSVFNAMIYMHMLLFGFWIGADVAVLYISHFVTDPKLPPMTRALFGRIMFKLDTLPIICMTLMLPVGLTLAENMGLSPIRHGWLFGVWVIGLIWLASLLYLTHARSGAAWLRTADRVFRVTLVVALTIAAIVSLVINEPFPQRWLAVKVLLFAIIVAASLGIDVSVRPFGSAMERLIAEGPEPELEQVVSRTIRRAYPFVYVMYAAILCAAAVAVF